MAHTPLSQTHHKTTATNKRLSASPPPAKLVAPVTDMLRALRPYAPAWLAAVLAAVGVVPGADALVAGIMAGSSAEAASLVRAVG